MTQAPQNGVFVRTNQDARRDLKVSSFSSLGHVKVCNQEMLLVISEKNLVHRTLLSSSKQAEIHLPISASDSIRHVHLSPNGVHSIVSSKNGDNFYINLKNNVPIALKKIHDVISAVGWNPECLRDNDTGLILLGTTTGTILETSISAAGVLPFVKEHATNFGTEKELSKYISDIRMYVINDEDPKSVRYVLFVCQPAQLHYMYASINTIPPPKSNYMSTASLQTFVTMPEIPQHIYHPFFSLKDVQQTSLCMRPMDSTGHAPSFADSLSSLVFYSSREDPSQPFKFLWLGPHGYTIGKVNLVADKPRDILVEEKHAEHRRIEGRLECPIAASMTEYHILLAYSTRMLAVSIHTYAVVFEDIWPLEYGTALGLSFDPVSEYHWMYTASTIMKYRPNDETRYVWRVFLDNGDYGKALAVARDRLAIDPDAHQLVLKRQADKHLLEKNFTAAAEILAESNESFETVVLKFLSTDGDRRMGLKTLLEKKLDKLTSVEDRIRRDALVMWLLEVQLAELAEVRREKDGPVDGTSAAVDLAAHLQLFLSRKTVQDSIVSNKVAVYKLMVSHADFDSQLYLAQTLRDYDTVISIYLLREQYKDALEVLKSQASSEAIYQYSPVLVEHIPMELFSYLIRNDKVRPVRMIPTICQCQKEVKMAVSAIKYLEWAVSTPIAALDTSLHNLLILMYAKFRPKRLHEHLVSLGMDKSIVPYDFDFALRTCEQYNLDRSTIYLYCVSEMFCEAVEMALKLDIELAKECVHLMDASDDDVIMGIESKYPKEHRRRIWLRIASFIIELDGDAEKCISLLKESGGVISIQDIFPLFPDFTKIEHFKDSLCNCLKDHSDDIQKIQRSLKDATETAQEIRDRSEKLKSRVTVVKAGDQCASCHRSLAGRPFYPFACRHFYHRECLEEAMIPFLNLEQQKKLSDLIFRERRVLTQLDLEEKSPSKAAVAERETRFEEISNEINDILGSECPLCGFMAIEFVDKPFFNDVDFANDQDSWIV